MELNEYQRMALRTASDMPPIRTIQNAVYGMCGEAGECIDYLKKIEFQGHEFDPNRLMDEAGDCLWYIALLAKGLGVTMNDIAQHNIDKLWKRYPTGFDCNRSVHRSEFEVGENNG